MKQGSFLLKPFWLVFYAAAVLLVGAAVHRKITAFEGMVVVERGRSESLALRPAAPGGMAAHRAMPLEVLPLDNPAAAKRLLDGSQDYDAVPLGFHLKLAAAEVIEQPPDREVVEARRGAQFLSVDARPGATFDWQGRPCRVESVSPWAGLIRDPAGARRAALSWRPSPGAEWEQGVFLEPGAWFFLQPAAALLLEWKENREEADGLPETLAPLDHARWGVKDTRRIHWFTNFAPGTGVRLDSGAEYTLAAMGKKRAGERELPALGVEITEKGATRPVAVTANAAETVEGVLFECPAAMPAVVRLNAWRDGAALAAVYADGNRVTEPALLAEGETMALPGGVELRLDQVMARGVAVGARGAPVRVAAVRMGETTHRLREGLAVQAEGATLRYRRLPQPPRVKYTLESKDGGDSFELRPGEMKTFHGWRFSIAGDNLDAARTAVLHARRAWITQREMLGGLFLLAVTGGWLVLRLGKKDKPADMDGVKKGDEEDWAG